MSEPPDHEAAIRRLIAWLAHAELPEPSADPDPVVIDLLEKLRASLPAGRPTRPSEGPYGRSLEPAPGESVKALPRLLYLDTSALAKLVQPEPETEPLRAEVTRWPDHATSVVGEIELRRVARRADREEEAERVLQALLLVELDEPVRRQAAKVGGAELRTLDAIHLASALSLEGLELGFACYDARLAGAAAAAGLTVLTPGS